MAFGNKKSPWAGPGAASAFQTGRPASSKVYSGPGASVFATDANPSQELMDAQMLAQSIPEAQARAREIAQLRANRLKTSDLTTYTPSNIHDGEWDADYVRRKQYEQYGETDIPLEGPKVAVADSYGNVTGQDPVGDFAPKPFDYSAMPAASDASGAGLSALWDWDTTQPWAAEKAFSEHGQDLFAPGQLAQWAQTHQQAFDTPGADEQLWQEQQASPTVNNAQLEYNKFHRPDIASEPGYGSYYDRAADKVTDKLNTELGARGAYGSSVGLGQIGESLTDLRADQARTEADYNLSRLGEQRQWDTLGGTLARNADLSGQSNLTNRSTIAHNANDALLARTKAGYEASKGVDAEQRERYGMGFDAAQSAGTERGARIGLGNNAITEATGSLQSQVSAIYNAWLAGDTASLDGQQAALLAKYVEQERYNASQQGRPFDESRAIYSMVMSGYTGGMGGGGGGGGGGG